MTGHCVVCMQTDADLVPWHANVQSCPTQKHCLHFNLTQKHFFYSQWKPRSTGVLAERIIPLRFLDQDGYPIYPTYIYIIQGWLPSGYD